MAAVTRVLQHVLQRSANVQSCLYRELCGLIRIVRVSLFGLMFVSAVGLRAADSPAAAAGRPAVAQAQSFADAPTTNSRRAAAQTSTRRVFGGLARGGPVFSSSGSWYLSAEDRYLYRLEPGSLRTVQRVALPGRPTNALTVAPWGTVYVGLENGGLMAVSEAGREVFRIRPEYSRALPFALGADGELVVAYPDSRVLRAYGSSGVLLWSVALSDVPVLPPVVSFHGDIVIATADRRLHRIGSGGARYNHTELDSTPRLVAAPAEFVPPGNGSTPSSSVDVLVVLSDRVLFMGRDGQGSAPLKLNWGDLRELHQLDSNSFVGRRSDGQAVYISWQQQLELAEDVVWLSSVGGAPLLGLRNGGLMLFSPVHGVRSRAPIEEGRGFTRGAYAYGHVLMAAENWGVYGLRVGGNGFGAGLPSGSQTGEAGWIATRGDYAATGRPQSVVFRTQGPAEWRRIPDFLYLEDMLNGESASGRRDLLAELRQRYRPGRAGPDIIYLRHILEALATEAYFNPIRRDGLIRNDFPWARAEALRLLGARPDYRTRSLLIRAGTVERNLEVRMVVLEQLSNVGIDPDLQSANLALRYLKEAAGRRPHEPLAAEALRTLRILRRIEGEKVDPVLREAYRVISEQDFSRELREESLRGAREIDQSEIDSYTE